MNRPKYFWTLFFAFQGIVFALCWFFQISGVPDDLWRIALAHIPVCMVFHAMETSLHSAPEPFPDMYSTDEYAHLFTTKEHS